MIQLEDVFGLAAKLRASEMSLNSKVEPGLQPATLHESHQRLV